MYNRGSLYISKVRERIRILLNSFFAEEKKEVGFNKIVEFIF